MGGATTNLRVTLCCRLSRCQKEEEVGSVMFSWDGNRLRIEEVFENSLLSIFASSSRLLALPHMISCFSSWLKVGMLPSSTHFPYLILSSCLLRHSRHNQSTWQLKEIKWVSWWRLFFQSVTVEQKLFIGIYYLLLIGNYYWKLLDIIGFNNWKLLLSSWYMFYH